MSDTYRKTPPAANGTVDALLAGHGKTAKLGLYLALGGLGLFLLFLLLLHSPVVLILAILLVVAGLIVRSIAVGKMKTVAAGSLIPEALSTVLEQVRYDAKSRISDNVVCHTDMGFPFDFDEIKGGDYVSGVYRGLRMEMSDLELVDVRRIVDSGSSVSSAGSCLPMYGSMNGVLWVSSLLPVGSKRKTTPSTNGSLSKAPASTMCSIC